jgi:hypothetical protein
MKSYRPFVLAVSALCGAVLSAQAEDKASAPTTGPKIDFAETTFNFGKVKVGEVVKHSFVFTNSGSSTLNILEVKPGCGCTTAGTWDKTVEPGKTGSIPLQFNSTGFGGPVTKMATVTSSDTAHSNVVLQLTGTVWRPIDTTPTMAMFNVSPDDQTNEVKTIHIVSNVDEPITLSAPEISSPSFKAELVTVKPGKEFDLKVTSIPPFTNSYVSAPIKIKTSSKEMPEINATAYATVMPAVQIMPQQLMLPAGPIATNNHPIVTVRANGSRNLKLSDATINIPGAAVSLKEAQPGKLFYLSLSFPPGFQLQPGQHAEVSVKSDHPQFSQIKIPVTQPVMPAGQQTTIRIPGTAASNTTTAH